MWVLRLPPGGGISDRMSFPSLVMTVLLTAAGAAEAPEAPARFAELRAADPVGEELLRCAALDILLGAAQQDAGRTERAVTARTRASTFIAAYAHRSGASIDEATDATRTARAMWFSRVMEARSRGSLLADTQLVDQLSLCLSLEKGIVQHYLR